MEQAPFCGRDREVAKLLADWTAVATGQGPRVATIIGEPGLGKTRLAQVVYDAIVRNHGGGYWPPVLGRLGNNLQVNPQFDADREGLPPFLWWGLRLVDPFTPNSVGAGVLASGAENHLRPQVAPFRHLRRRKARRSEALSVGKGLALDLAIDIIPFGGLAKTLGEAGMDLHRLYREDRADTSGVANGGLIDAILDDIELAMEPDGASPRPAVILIDDAQFSTHDPGTTAFVSGLMKRALAGNWPLFLLLTHWEREWDDPVPGSIAATLAASDIATIRTIRLSPLPDLSPLIEEGLPGLTDPQKQALLARADGNPRYLGEIILFATGARGLFAGGDTRGPLTENGLSRLLARSTTLHDITANRLRESPWEVQQAVSLGTLQGVEFLECILGQMAAQLVGDEGTVTAAVTAAERPHAYLRAVDPGIAAFAQRIYYEVAAEHLENCFDPDEARNALEQGVRDLASSDRFHAFGREERRRFLTLAAALFEGAEAIPDRMIAASCLHLLGDIANREGDIHLFRDCARRLDTLIRRSGDEVLDSDLNWLRMIYYAADGPDTLETEARVLAQMCRLTEETLQDDQSDWAIWMHVRSLALLAEHHLNREQPDQALEAAWTANRLLEQWPITERTATELWAWIDLYGAVARALAMLDTPAKALDWYDAQILVADRLLALEPDEPDAARSRASAEQQAGRLAFELGDTDLARARLERSAARYRDIAATGEHASEFAAALVNLATALAESAPEEAACLRAEAVVVARNLVKKADVAEHRHLLAWILYATARAAADDVEKAASLATEAAALHRQDKPHEAAPPAQVAVIEAAAAVTTMTLGRADEALAHALRMRDLARIVTQRDPEGGAETLLLAALVQVARSAQKLGDYGMAALHIDEAKNLYARPKCNLPASFGAELEDLMARQPSLH